MVGSRDINRDERTSSHEPEDQRRALEEELRALRNTVVDGLIIIDDQKRVQSFNPAAERIFGYRAEEVLGRNVKLLMPQPYHAEHDAYVDRYRETGDARIIGSGREVVGQRKDGTTFPMYLSVGEMNHGGIRQFVGIVHDITAMRQAKEELREHEELLAGIAANLPGPVFRRVLHPDGRNSFPYVSEGLKRVFAIDPQGVKADPEALIEAIHTADRAGWADALTISAQEMTPCDHQMRITGSDGVERWMHVLARPFRRDDGEIVWDGLALDVTERQAAQAQLRQAQKIEAVGQLTGGIAHDFNNLLAVLMMDLESLEELTGEDDVRHEIIEEARETTQSAADLTRQLLAFARRQPLEPKIIDPAALLARTTALLHRTLGGSIRIDHVQSSNLWPVAVDPSQMESAVLNLAINARDAMPDGGTLAIASENTVLADIAGVDPGEYVCIEIGDTGTGMPNDVVERAFEPFFTTKEMGRGTGMGLSMVHGFVKQSGGHIEIDSEPGRGTKVSLYFPRAAGSVDAPDLAVASEAQARTRILYVEDHPQLRRRTGSVLKDLGYEVSEAEEAAAALARIEDGQRFDLLFTDVVMPGGIDGIELAERARAIQPGLKVVFTSGYSDDARLQGEALESWAMLLRKPFSRTELIERLHDILDHRS